MRFALIVSRDAHFRGVAQHGRWHGYSVFKCQGRGHAVYRVDCSALLRLVRHGSISDGQLAVGIFIAVAVAYWIALPHIDIQGNHPISDGAIHGAMADHPAARISVRLFGEPWVTNGLPAPFVFRVFIPWSVWALPFRTQTGFQVVNVLGVAGTAALLFLYARTFFDRAAGFRAVAFFVVAGNVLGVLMDPWLVDGPAFFWSILAFLLVRRDRLGWATVVLCFGVATHESLAIVLGTLFVAHLVDRDGRFAWRLVPFVGFPLLVYLVIHNTSLVYGTPVTYEFWSAATRQAVLDTRRHFDGALTISVLFAFAASFGGLWALAMCGFRVAPRFLRATVIMLPALALNFLTAADWDRVATAAFPVVIVLACGVRLRWPVLAALVAVQAWLSGVALNRNAGYYVGNLAHPQTALTVVLLAVAVAFALVGGTTTRRPVQTGDVVTESAVRSS